MKNILTGLLIGFLAVSITARLTTQRIVKDNKTHATVTAVHTKAPPYFPPTSTVVPNATPTVATFQGRMCIGGACPGGNKRPIFPPTNTAVP